MGTEGTEGAGLDGMHSSFRNCLTKASLAEHPTEEMLHPAQMTWTIFKINGASALFSSGPAMSGIAMRAAARSNFSFAVSVRYSSKVDPF